MSPFLRPAAPGRPRFRRALLPLCVCTLLAAGTAAAQDPQDAAAAPPPAAQTEGRGVTQLDEVMVTAQKRTESIMEVPISLTAISAEEIEALRAVKVDDYITSIPNASFVNSGGYWGKTVTFRGISQFGGGRYEVISVAVDDVGYGAINSASILSSQLLDIERIEVLRGPQGTLSGRNSLGGSINITNAVPDPERFLLKGTLDYGRFNTLLTKAVINAPLADNLALRALAYKEHSDGAIRNVAPGGKDSGYDNAGGRVALRWMPTERLTLDASLGHEKLDRDLEDWITGDFVTVERREAMLAELARWGGSYPGPVDLLPDVGNNGGRVSKDIQEMTRIENWIGSFKASYAGDRHQFDLIYGHFDYDIAYREDYDQTEYAWWMTERSRSTTTDSLELRVTSGYDGPLNWVAGVSYLDEELRTLAADNIGSWAVEGGTPRYGGGSGAYVPAYLGASYDLMKSLGAFGNLYWRFGEAFRLSVGGRYSIEKTRYGSGFVYEEGNPDLALGPLVDYPEADIREFSPRVALNYDFRPNTTAYLQYSTGYRAGYSNNVQAIGVGAQREVDPEYVRNYELGFKGRFLDNRFELSTALFYMDYSDLQVQTQVPDELNPYPFNIYYDINAGSATTRGFELEAQALVTDRLRLGLGVGYTDANIDQVILDGVEYRDQRIPNVRPWTATATAEYVRPFGEHEARFRLDYRWQDDMFWQGVLENPEYYLPAFRTLDASIGFAAQDQRWSVSLYATNVLNEQYYNSIGWVEVGFRGRMVHTPPRMFGVRFNVQFE